MLQIIMSLVCNFLGMLTGGIEIDERTFFRIEKWWLRIITRVRFSLREPEPSVIIGKCSKYANIVPAYDREK